MSNEFPILITDRLILRRLKESDVKQIRYLRSDPLINKYISRPVENQTKTEEDALKFIRKMKTHFKDEVAISWGITKKDHNIVIGTICLWNYSLDKTKVEVGYDLSVDYQKKGYMSEALQSVVTFAFEKMKFRFVEAYTQFDNLDSISLLTRNGFVFQKDRRCEVNPANRIYLRESLIQ